MGFYDSPENVEQYVSMADGHDGRTLIEEMRRYLEPGSCVLEIGMGPGIDLDLLRTYFNVTGSDASDVFIQRYLATHPGASVLELDAVTLDTDRRFDGIFSNKVLHHLNPTDQEASFQRQAAILNPGGAVRATPIDPDGQLAYFQPMSVPLLDKSIRFDGREVRYGITGEGPPMVIVHGTPWSSFNLRHLIEGLSADFQVHYFDLLGYGVSEKSPGDVSLGIQNEVFAALLDHWSISKPVVVGHDFGGATALRTHLLNGHDFERLVLIDAVAVSPWGSSFFRHVNRHEAAFSGLPDYLQEVLVRRYIQSAAYQSLSEYMLEHTAAPWLGSDGKPALYRQMAQADQRYTDEVESRYGEITMPVLVLWGAEDAWIPIEQGRKLTEAIRGARFVTLPDTGHLVIEEAPGALIKEVLAFCHE